MLLADVEEYRIYLTRFLTPLPDAAAAAAAWTRRY